MKKDNVIESKFVRNLNKLDYERNKKDYENRTKMFYPKRTTQHPNSKKFEERWL